MLCHEPVGKPVYGMRNVNTKLKVNKVLYFIYFIFMFLKQEKIKDNRAWLSIKLIFSRFLLCRTYKPHAQQSSHTRQLETTTNTQTKI
jgi:uncharacterized phage-associated protein